MGWNDLQIAIYFESPDILFIFLCIQGWPIRHWLETNIR